MYYTLDVLCLDAGWASGMYEEQELDVTAWAQILNVSSPSAYEILMVAPIMYKSNDFYWILGNLDQNRYLRATPST